MLRDKEGWSPLSDQFTEPPVNEVLENVALKWSSFPVINTSANTYLALPDIVLGFSVFPDTSLESADHSVYSGATSIQEIVSLPFTL